MGKAVYRGLDKETIDQQYQPRANTPNVDEVLADWAAKGRAHRAGARMARDLAYGDSPGQRLDLFLPENAAGAPVHVFVHGGYWRALDKDDYSFALAPLTAAGAIVANLNYDLCPAVTLDQVVEQVRRAIAWVYANVGEHGGDPARIHLSGHSAGAHLAAMLMATDWPERDPKLPADMFKSVTLISGVYDLEPVFLSVVNNDIGLDREVARRNSPILLNPARDVPLTVAVGGGETDEFRRQSRDFANAWLGKVSSLAYTEIPGDDHFHVVDGLTRPDSPLMAVITRKMGL